MRRALAHLSIVAFALCLPSTLHAELLLFSGETLNQGALHPLVDFGEGGTQPLSSLIQTLATTGARDGELLVLNTADGSIRSGFRRETVVSLRDENGLKLPAAAWLTPAGNVLLINQALEEISPAAIDRSFLTTRTGRKIILRPDGTVFPVPEPNFALGLAAGGAALAFWRRPIWPR